MKRTFVKVLSLMLALAMMAGSFVTVAYAEDAVTCPGKDGRHTLENTTNYEVVKEYAPTCTKDGYTSYQCQDCNVIFVDTYVKAETTEHAWGEAVEGYAPTCTEAGAYTYQQCTVCEAYLINGEEYNSDADIVIEALGHDYQIVSTTGNCLVEGVVTWECTNCGDTRTEGVAGTGKGHKWVLVSIDVEPSVDAEGNTVPGSATYKCSECTATETFPVGCAHDEAVKIPAVEPTCTETGLTEGKKCSVCGYITVAQEEVDALGHTEVVDEAVAPTCTTTGLTAGVHCDECGEVLTAQEVVEEALCEDATLVEFGAVEGSCTVKAVKAGEKCSVCEHVWTDAEELDYVHSTTEVVVPATCTTAGFKASYCDLCEQYIGEPEIISALGHTENLSWEYVVENELNINYVGATCEVDGQYSYYCENGCGHVMTVVLSATGHETVTVELGEATCNTYYYKADFCTNEWCDYADVTTVTVNEIEFSVVSEAGRYVPDSISVVFEFDAQNHTALEILATVQEATCVTPGHAITYCADCNHTELQYVIDPLGHSWEREEASAIVVDVIAPTCTEAGYTVYKCTDCDETIENLNEGDDVAATGHNSNVELPGSAASCLVDGLTAGTACDVCGETTLAQEVIPAAGHNLTYVETLPAKCDGTRVQIIFSCDGDNCDNDGIVVVEGAEYEYVSTDYYDTVDAANQVHVLDLSTMEVLRELTCEIDGLVGYTCAECGKTVVIYTPASYNHDWREDAEVPADCENAGTKAGKTCEICGATEGYGEIEALGHDFATEWTYDETNHWYDCSRCDAIDAEATHELSDEITTDPTCTELGVRTYTCDCGYTYTEDVDSLGHDFATEWTHDEEGHWYDCSRCDAVDAEAAHEFSSEITTDPTCTEPGVKTYTCDCGYTYDEEVEADGHSFVATGVTSTLGCLTDNYVEYACEDCLIVELREYLPAHGHVEVIDEAVAPDCDDTGLTEGRHCEICGDADENYYIAQEEIDATGIHKNSNGDVIVDSCLDTNEDRICVECGETVGQTHGEDIEVTYAPTCVNVGYTVQVCLVCGLEIAEPTDVQAPTGVHSYGEWYEVTAPTCTETGLNQRDCEYCDAYETDVVDATGHTAGEYDYNDDEHWNVCDDCGVKLTATVEDHDWILDEIVSEPKPGVAGEYAYVCTCGATKTEYPLFEGLKVSFDYANGTVNGAAVVNGGLVVLNVYLEGTEIDVETIQIKFAYDADRLTYVSNSWTLFETAIATCKNGVGTILLDGKAGDTAEHSAVTINGKVCVGQIVFRVDDYEDVLVPEEDIDATTTSIEFTTVSALTNVDADEDGDNDYIGVRFEEATLEVTVEKLGAISTNDKFVGINDLSAIKEFVYDLEADYNARADINQDGYVDAFDYIYLAEYLGGVYTYAELVAIGVQ